MKEADELCLRLKQALNWIERGPYSAITPRYEIPGESVYGIRVYGHRAIQEYEDALNAETVQDPEA